VDQRKITIVAIGDEVLYGYTANNNASLIAQNLVQRGFFPVSHRVVSDNPEDIFQILQEELLKGRDVITTGGLGPTVDDHTKAVISSLFQKKLVHQESLYKQLQKQYGDTFPTLKDQSLQPEGAQLFCNNTGTAPGLLLEDTALFPNARLFALPGPPQEMQMVFKEMLDAYFSGSPLPFYALSFVNMAEHEVNKNVQDLQKRWPQIRFGIYPSFSMVRLHLYVEQEEDRSFLEQAQEYLVEAFHNNVLPSNLLEKSLQTLLQKKKWSLATAESCTAGGLAARISSVDGASSVFSGSVVAYRNDVKERILSVPKTTLDNFGEVSEEVTACMAEGVQSLFNADVACAVSGFFGPTGGTKKAPVGTVCTTIALPNNVYSETFFFHGTREAICEKTIQALLSKLVSLLLQC